jgi:glycosyltransferase involved in cell wall biosynthesis
LSKKFRTRFIITEHWTKIDKFFSSSLYSFLGKRAFNAAHAITCVSAQLANTVQKHTSNKNIRIVPNVIDAHEFYYNAAITKNAQFTFVAVAHWAQHKNPFYFLDALQILVSDGKLSDFKVVMIGDGEQIQRIKDKGYNFTIEFKGSLTSPEVCTELNKSQVFLHGSDFETFSVIIAEALMCGLPSVVSPVGIGPEVINASNGFVTNNTVKDWSEKIISIYNTSYNYQAISDQLKGKYDAETVGNLFLQSYA